MLPLDTSRTTSQEPAGSPYSQASSAPSGGTDERYGKVGAVPWSFAQTLRGLAYTLVPWYAFIVLSQVSTPSARPRGTLSRGDDLAQGITLLIVTSLIEAVFLAAPLYYAIGQRARGTSRAEGLRALGFRAVPLGSTIALVLGGILAVLAVSYLYGALVEYFQWGIQTNVQTLVDEVHREPITVICTLVGAVLVAPVCEEVFFRGYAFAGLLRGMSVLPAALLSALLFTAAHGDIGSAAPLFVLGVILAIVRWRSGSIWPGIALHACNNLVAALFVIAVLAGH